jgi:hypothetical protein
MLYLRVQSTDGKSVNSLIQSHVIPAINSRGSHRGISTLEEIVVDTKLRDAKG